MWGFKQGSNLSRSNRWALPQMHGMHVLLLGVPLAEWQPIQSSIASCSV